VFSKSLTAEISQRNTDQQAGQAKRSPTVVNPVARSAGNVGPRNLRFTYPDYADCHYVKARVKVHRSPDGHPGIFHEPHNLANCAPEGKLAMLRHRPPEASARRVAVTGKPLRATPFAASRSRQKSTQFMRYKSGQFQKLLTLSADGL
jgi:hypothetical protein